MKCDSCGAPVENGKCTYCGKSFEETAEAPVQQMPVTPKPAEPEPDKKKMKQCKTCDGYIAKKAKKCPHCGAKNKKPIFKKWWFWLLIAVIVISAVGGSGGKNDKSDSKKIGEVAPAQSATQSKEPTAETSKSSPEKEEDDAPAEETEEDVQTVYKVGDILHDGDMDIVYVSSGDYNEDNEFLQPADGKKYIFMNFAFINTSSKSDSSISSFSFECYADEYSCESYYGGDDDLSATLSAGRATQGCVYFEVPSDAKEIEVEYETNVFTQDKITFVFEGDKDSGYVLQKNTAATEGALKVGDTVTSDSLNITYLSCQSDTSDNMFITPKDGCHYVTCEFEFENVSKSDILVSSFSFNCYADGASCDGAYFRDDNISATISAGRKAKGTVTFEVPDGAAVTEFEYLANYWTSNRVVFDASGY